MSYRFLINNKTKIKQQQPPVEHQHKIQQPFLPSHPPVLSSLALNWGPILMARLDGRLKRNRSLLQVPSMHTLLWPLI